MTAGKTATQSGGGIEIIRRTEFLPYEVFSTLYVKLAGAEPVLTTNRAVRRLLN